MDPDASDPDYGHSFADVYDDWYAHVTDAEATADRVAHLAAETGCARVLELGVGSGRLALPLAHRGLPVVGVDNSPAMVELLATKPGGERVETHLGDMTVADELVDGPFGVVLIAFNTLFNLADPARQQRCLDGVARLLAAGGSLMVETAVWGEAPERVERGLSTTRVDLDRVVLSATEHDPITQVVTGQHIDITAAGTRLRPWRIRYLTPDQLDEMATGAGLERVERHRDWEGGPLDGTETVHVSRYRRPPDPHR